MPLSHPVVATVPVPPESRIVHAFPSTDYADAYSVELPSGATTDPEQLARTIFERPSPVVRFLLKARDTLVGVFGLKTAKRLPAETKDGISRIDIFRIYRIDPAEIILGEDDTHLDFRVSVHCSGLEEPGEKRCVTLSTVVHFHNRFGRFYFFVIAPFHRLLAQSGLRRAARNGWPTTGTDQAFKRVTKPEDAA